GNFANNEDTRTYYIRFRPEQQAMLANGAYYYIDDVRVVPAFGTRDPTEQLPVFSGEEPELNTLYVLKNIQFEFNSYTLLPESYYDLDNVVRYLRENPDVSISLAGHTDDIGDEAYNLALSERRSRS